MNPIGLCVCEICGTLSSDHAGWFTVAGAGTHMEILPWTDKLHASPECSHACCGEHLQQLVFSTAAREFARPEIPFGTHREGWSPSSLVPMEAANQVASDASDFRGVLDVIESILQGPTADEEDAAAFDA